VSKTEIGRGAAFLYIEAVTMLFSGYFFWLVMSKITTPTIIGSSSALISLAAIFSTVITVGVPSGVQRFLGKSFSQQKLEDTKLFVKGSLLLVSAGIFVSSLIMLVARDWIYVLFRVDFASLVVSILLIGSTALSLLLRSIVVASLKTKIITIVSIISTVAKFAIAVILVLMGTGALGITIGFTSFPILTSVLLIFTTVMILFKLPTQNKPASTLSHALKNLLTVSMTFWIPSVIATIGFQLGTIVVFGTQGAYQAGLYFVALSIVTGISLVMTVLSTIAFPAMSAMTDGRKRMAWRIIKLTLITTLPFSSAIIFYSREIMQLFGAGYIEGSSTLEILLLSILPNAIVGGITILVFSYGNNKQVLMLGLASSLPRTILYFLLVPIYGGVGAAITYLIGSLIGFVLSIIIAKKVKMRVLWKDLGYVILIPTILAFLLYYIGINYIIGIVLTLVISYLIFLKIRIIDKYDLADFIGLLPKDVGARTLSLLTAIAKKTNRFY
jgi:O-antigen/teichoic acid export membrane protein